LWLADWPIALDTRALTEEGRIVLAVGLKCEVCGRRTFHHFASKQHFEELIGLFGLTVPDERRLVAREARRQEAAKCVWCSTGVPQCVIT
jgi:hypothetical protein